jgi:hypothetical protein
MHEFEDFVEILNGWLDIQTSVAATRLEVGLVAEVGRIHDRPSRSKCGKSRLLWSRLRLESRLRVDQSWMQDIGLLCSSLMIGVWSVNLCLIFSLDIYFGPKSQQGHPRSECVESSYRSHRDILQSLKLHSSLGN